MTGSMTIAQQESESDFDRLVIWRDSHADFNYYNGLPSSWFENAHWGCAKGHVSSHYIKSEADGEAICPCCLTPVLLVPPGTTEEMLTKALAGDHVREGDRSAGMTDPARDYVDSQFSGPLPSVKPSRTEMAYGLLWMTMTGDKRINMARRLLLETLDKAAQERGIKAAMEMVRA